MLNKFFFLYCMCDHPSFRIGNMILWKEIIQMRFLHNWWYTVLQKKFFFLTPCQVIVFFFIFVVFLMLQTKDKNNNNFIYDALTPKYFKKWLLVMFQKSLWNRETKNVPICILHLRKQGCKQAQGLTPENSEINVHFIWIWWPDSET